MMEGRAIGPEAYVPSIEPRYGRANSEWRSLMRASGLTSHGALVAWLTVEHAFGRGHDTATVGHLLGEGAPALDRDQHAALPFLAAKAHWRPHYDALVERLKRFGNLAIRPKQSLIGFATKVQFAVARPSGLPPFDVGLKLQGVPAVGRLEPVSGGRMMTHRVRVTESGAPKAELVGWLRRAYDASPEGG